MVSASSKTDLAGMRVMLSASIPDGVAGTALAQELYSAVVVLTRRILAAGGHLVFGGHPSITPLIRRAAGAVTGRPAQITLFQAERFRVQAPKEVKDPTAFPDVRWVGEPDAGIAESLALLREAMAADSDAAVFIGGRGSSSLTPVPGVQDEYERFLAGHAGGPLYLIGLLGGEARRLAEQAERGEVPEPNGLDPDARHQVHFGRDLDLIAPMIASDLAARARSAARAAAVRSDRLDDSS